jgi:hypothetical protein
LIPREYSTRGNYVSKSNPPSFPLKFTECRGGLNTEERK